MAGATAASISLWDWSERLTVAGSVAVDRGVVVRLIILGPPQVLLRHTTWAFGRGSGKFYRSSCSRPRDDLIAVAADLVVVFLALEILSLALYV
jgi:hypothetical protein